jgi:hypothetical protein
MTGWSLGVDESGVLPEDGKLGVSGPQPMVVAGVLVPLASGFDARSLRDAVTNAWIAARSWE